MQLPLVTYQQLLQDIHGYQLVYYEDFDRNEQENSFLDRQVRADNDAPGTHNGPLHQLLETGLRDRLVQAIETILERERLLLSLCYEQELNLREIDAVMEVSQSRVCQSHSQVTSRLHALMVEHL